MRADLAETIKPVHYQPDGLTRLLARYQARIAPREKSLLRGREEARCSQHVLLAAEVQEEARLLILGRAGRIEFEKLAKEKKTGQQEVVLE